MTASGGPFKCAITLDLSGMNRLISVDVENGLATAESGIYGPALEKALAAPSTHHHDSSPHPMDAILQRTAHTHFYVR